MIEVEREEMSVDGKGIKWRWSVRGRPDLCGLSSEPLLDACRAVKSTGADTSTEIALFQPGRTGKEWDLRTTVEYGASKTVRETQRDGVRFIDYVPFDPAKLTGELPSAPGKPGPRTG
jgi:hypothetical protein